jgi:organic radical activating enzyme
LFRYNSEKEAPIQTVIEKLKYSIENSNKPVYIKITGGEPFIYQELLDALLYVCEEYKPKIYKIGIGTNGSIEIPKFFERVTTKTHIFLSRHSISTLPRPKELMKFKNDRIDFRHNCNLIKGGVDSVEKIEEYIRAYADIDYFCFRELSKVNIDLNLLYGKEIYDYIEYYENNVVLVSDLKFNDRFTPSRLTGNYYDVNRWYWYDCDGRKVSVKFRTIDEGRLIEYNNNFSGIDEYVIHPDGTLTGCWDKNLKEVISCQADHIYRDR